MLTDGGVDALLVTYPRLTDGDLVGRGHLDEPSGSDHWHLVLDQSTENLFLLVKVGNLQCRHDTEILLALNNLISMWLCFHSKAT